MSCRDIECPGENNRRKGQQQCENTIFYVSVFLNGNYMHIAIGGLNASCGDALVELGEGSEGGGQLGRVARGTRPLFVVPLM